MRESSGTSTRTKGAMKSKEEWLRKRSHNPPISKKKQVILRIASWNVGLEISHSDTMLQVVIAYQSAHTADPKPLTQRIMVTTGISIDKYGNH
jgi:hypothetical protein